MTPKHYKKKQRLFGHFDCWTLQTLTFVELFQNNLRDVYWQKNLIFEIILTEVTQEKMLAIED